MRYVALLTETAPEAWDLATEAEREAVIEAHRAFDAEIERRGEILDGRALDRSETATTLRYADGSWRITDGPFAETVEQLGGFYVVEMPDLDAMIAAARLLPTGYTVEIRPVVSIPDY
ncbi:MAG: YciI family protein [Nocardioides sp.]